MGLMSLQDVRIGIVGLGYVGLPLAVYMARHFPVLGFDIDAGRIAELRAGKDRYSVAFFLDPNPDAIVACLPTCISADRPAKYQPITGAEFLRSRLEPTYAARKANG